MRSSKNVDVCLVSMPFADVTMPSLALSLLKSCLTEAGISSVVQYEYLYYAHRLGKAAYQSLAMSRTDFLIGEMIFARAAHKEPLRPLSQYREWILNRRLPWGYDEEPELAEKAKNSWLGRLAMWQQDAEAFIEESAARILARHPKIVAIGSMFQQTNASIALARRLKKEKNPPVIMVGGSNCLSDQGTALIEHIEAYDYVFLGEADEIFAGVCQRILSEGEIPPEELPYGVLSRRSAPPSTPLHRVTKDVEALPIPDFDDYFTLFRKLFPNSKSFHIMVEGSRGCWWGRKKPCTFCGLNGPARNYREKTAKRLADEIKVLAEKYPYTKLCIFTDSILSRAQMKELPAEIKKRKIKLQFFAEIKSNLTEEDVRSLAKCGFVQLQPGIESLQDDVLRIMNKGCRAIKQVETMKRCRTHNVRVTWNLLCGFPGEKEEYHAEIAALIPKIMHLAAPNQFTHIIYQRYGEYTENQEQYGLLLRPAEVYDFVFADKEFIRRSAYMFDPVDETALRRYWDVRKINKDYRKIYEYVNQWVGERYNLQRLDMYDDGAGISIFDMRDIARHTVYRLEGARADIYRACRAVRKKSSIEAEFSEKYSGDRVADALDWLCGENLMVRIGPEYLALAIDMNTK